MTMQPYQLRVIAEQQELDAKIALLNAFLNSEKSSTLDAAERYRMQRQLSAMTIYTHCLGERIANFVEA